MGLSSTAEAIFEKSKQRSEHGIANMRSIASEMFDGQRDFVIGVNGSFARQEVTSGSDVDLFFLTFTDDSTVVEQIQSEFRNKLVEAGFRLPSSGGVFEKPLSIQSTRTIIGGMDDSNTSITRRMLLLLEGEWVFNQKEFKNVRADLIDCYVDDNRREDQICMFLLNDIIRYWRTICVDFEYKVSADSKAKAVRLIKLRFSRLLLYLAGIIAIGETYKKTSKDKKATLQQLFALCPLDRLKEVAGDAADPVLELYSQFMIAIDDPSVRKMLEKTSPDGESSKEFHTLRESAQRFRSEIETMLRRKYDRDHPLLAALML